MAQNTGLVYTQYKLSTHSRGKCKHTKSHVFYFFNINLSHFK